MLYHPKSRLDSTDPRIARLVLYGICRQEDIKSMYERCGELFRSFITKEPRLAADVHRHMYLDERSVAQEQTWKRQATQIANGGPQAQAQIVNSDFESSKFLLLPLAIAIQAGGGKKGQRLCAILRSFQGQAKSVLESVAKEFTWLFPDVGTWATIRNSESHQSTVFHDAESCVVFSDVAKRVEMDYDQLVRFTHHETTGMTVANDVTTACFLNQMKLTLPPDFLRGDPGAVRAFLTKRLCQTRETRPTAGELEESERRRQELASEIRKHEDMVREE